MSVELIQPIPARSSYVMSADSNDFWGFRQPSGRMGLPFPPGVELSLRLTILEPSEAMLRFHWSGTLTSTPARPDHPFLRTETLPRRRTHQSRLTISVLGYEAARPGPASTAKSQRTV